jgi:hypothetical protein
VAAVAVCASGPPSAQSANSFDDLLARLAQAAPEVRAAAIEQ